MGELTAGLVRALSGVDIRTGSSVIGLGRAAEGGFRLVLGGGRELLAGGVVLATPARVTSGLLSGLAPEAASAIAGIGQVATSTVTLGYRASDLPPLMGSGFVVPSVEGRRIMGVSHLSQKWEGRVPDPSYTLLRAFVGGPNGQALALAGADHIEGVVRGELEELAGISARPVLSKVQTWDGGLHQYTLGHLQRVAGAESALASHPGLALAGSAFHGIGLNECVESGRRAAASVLAATAVSGGARLLAGSRVEESRK
jgi:oxygen-dependent protoporphyrinogen oxidase